MLFPNPKPTQQQKYQQQQNYHQQLVPIPSVFRLYSSTATTASELDGFFEKGGDMDRLVKELSGEQQNKKKHKPQYHNQNQTPNKNENKNSTSSLGESTHESNSNGWLRGQDILSLVEDANNNNNNDDKQQQQQQQQTTPSCSSSPVEIRTIRNKTVYIKHDDQLRLQGSGISGNKARKMWTLNEILPKDFPPCLVSYGGPQSNSMLALAAIANYKNRQIRLEQQQQEQEQQHNTSTTTTATTAAAADLPVRFVYYTKKLPRFLRKQPNGNLFRALSLGMELTEVSHEEYADLFEKTKNDDDVPPRTLNAPVPGSLWVPQGGAFPPARKGAQHLALEIVDYWSKQSSKSTEKKNMAKPLTVCVPGGTCTTALLLHHELQKLKHAAPAPSSSSSSSMLDIEVVVIPCVGDANYARRQMMSLSAHIGASPENIPTILQPQPEQSTVNNNNNNSNNKYFSFGKPDKVILDTFQELQDDCNLLVDLLYGAPSFSILWRHWGEQSSNNNLEDASSSSLLSPDLAFDPKQPLEGREIMYVHSGGLEGINSQLLRYKYNGLVEIKDVQLPGKQNRSKPTRRGKKKKQQ